MTKENRLRRIAKLRLHCIRNLSYYRERKEEILDNPKNQFWRTVDGNFIDICVLEWCKLFADTRGKHFWRKVVTNETTFFSGLLENLGCTQNEFEDYISDTKTYRDKFLAHLDNENTMHIPTLNWIETSTLYLYEYLLANEEQNGCFRDVPNIKNYHQQSSDEAKEIYNSL